MKTLILFILCIPASCLVIHEGGHYLVARFFGEKIKFRFSLGKLFGVIPVPRWVWTMPRRLSYAQRVAVALAGFGAELGVILPFWQAEAPWTLPYACFALLHLCLYRFYAGDANDFKVLAT